MTDEKDTEISSVDVIEDVFDDSKEESKDDPEPAKAEKEAQTEEDTEEDAKESEGEKEEDEEESGKEEKRAEPPSAEGSKDNKSVPLEALLSERQRRKAAEERVDAYKRKYEPEQDPDAPDPKKDPVAYENYVRDKVVREMRTKQTSDSRERMMGEHVDYEEVEAIFMVMAKRDQTLADEIAEHPDPARFAYEKAKKYLDGKYAPSQKQGAETPEKQGNTDAESKQPTEAEKRKKSATQLPDLTSAASKGRNSAPVEKDPSLDDIFADQSY